MLMKKIAEATPVSSNVLDNYVRFNVSASKKSEIYNVVFSFKSLIDSKDIIDFYENASN